jgi:hypothetical protein
VYVYMCILLSLLGNSSAKMLLRQWTHNNRIVEHVIFCAVCVVSRKVGE